MTAFQILIVLVPLCVSVKPDIGKDFWRIYSEIRDLTRRALILLFCISIAWIFGPIILSQIYNSQGYYQFNQGDLQAAKLSYEKAIDFYPDNVWIHYNLGDLYEELKDFEKAEAAYQIAIRGPSSSLVYNNLGRLYILEKEYNSAFHLLDGGLQSLNDLNQNQAYPNELSYTLHKNLGWLELEQKNNPAAYIYLQEAISIAEKNKIDASSSYCLLAQLPSENLDPKAHLERWQKCCQKEEDDITQIQPEEYEWLQLARQHLEKEGKQCHALVPKVSS